MSNFLWGFSQIFSREDTRRDAKKKNAAVMNDESIFITAALNYLRKGLTAY